MTTRIGYIGLGNMGAPMAKRLLDHIGHLSVLDTRPDAVAPFIEAGAHSVSNAAALASVSDIVCVTVLDDARYATSSPAPTDCCPPRRRAR